MLRTLLNQDSLTVAGIMSGTSLDGIDVALVRIDGSGVNAKARLIHFESYAYEEELRERLKSLCSIDYSDVALLCGMNFAIAERFADAVCPTAAAAGMSMTEIDLVSSHGQTVWHIPVADEADPFLPKSTLQIGDLSVIAKRTGRPVVGDFRTADMAVGGQGAPLAPYGDFIMFRDTHKGRILQNIGGIGNCTAIPARGSITDSTTDSVNISTTAPITDATTDLTSVSTTAPITDATMDSTSSLTTAPVDASDIIAFDTGPGNMVIDQVVYELSEGRLSYDADGAWAAGGQVHLELLADMLAHPYLGSFLPKRQGGNCSVRLILLHGLKMPYSRGFHRKTSSLRLQH